MGFSNFRISSLFICMIILCLSFIKTLANDQTNSLYEYNPSSWFLRADVCSSSGYFPNSSNCTKFYRCVDLYGTNRTFAKYDFECPPGTLYDPKLSICNHPNGVKVVNGCDSSSNCSTPSQLTSLSEPKFGHEDDKYCIYQINLQYRNASPDGVSKRIISINGELPGPVITCTRGKTLIVNVTNLLNDDDEPTSIHWHGIEQNLSPFYDGPEGVAQCPITKGNSMLYAFQLFQAGTYWYHSHHSYQYVDGAWGPLIIKNYPQEVWSAAYDDERTLTINDWHHQSAKILSSLWMMSENNFPIPDSTLINGIGQFNCSSCKPNYSIVRVTYGKRYRFRLINTSASQAYKFAIDNHKFVVIETDGVDTIKSPKVDMLEIYPAQRYSILIEMAQKSQKSFWIRANSTDARKQNINVLAILQYQVGNKETFAATQDSTPTGVQGRPYVQNFDWHDIILKGQNDQLQIPSDRLNYLKQNFVQHNKLSAGDKNETCMHPTTKPTNKPILLDQMTCRPYHSRGETTAPDYFDKQAVINVTFCSTNRTRACFNGNPFNPGNTGDMPILFKMIRGLPLPKRSNPVELPVLGDVIQIVINNRIDEPHPWHLHGHTFWVMGTGKENEGVYSNQRLSTRGVRRDTTPTLANSWVVIRFEVDNPGTWLLHCHINWHLEVGMGAVMIEAQTLAQKVYSKIPEEAVRICSLVNVTVF